MHHWQHELFLIISINFVWDIIIGIFMAIQYFLNYTLGFL